MKVRNHAQILILQIVAELKRVALATALWTLNENIALAEPVVMATGKAKRYKPLYDHFNHMVAQHS